MKIEELKEVSLTAKRPDKDMTDEKWQEYFGIMKTLTHQGNEKRMNSRTSPILINGYSDGQFTYQNDTQWTKYKEFINSILSAIRQGECDYCFYIYQIAELLRYEHDELRTKWLPDENCFQVWLNKRFKDKAEKV